MSGWGEMAQMVGVPVWFEENPLMVEPRQFRFPRSKKRRIRKKWAKRSCNYREEPRRDYLKMDNTKFGGRGITIIAHPTAVARLKSLIEEFRS